MATHRSIPAGAPPPARPPARAFTLLEILFSILIIFLIMGLLLSGLHLAMKSAHGSANRAAVAGLKMGADKFRQEMGFVPPLVRDNGPGAPVIGNSPQVYRLDDPNDLEFLRGGPPAAPLPDPDLRYSIYSLGYYIAGVLDKDVDGVDGPGFREPRRDGSFAITTGRQFAAFYDISRTPRAIGIVNAQEGRIELRDSRGVPIRYYRWLPDAGQAQANDPINQFLNIPVLVGDPAEDLALRSAAYAIVAAGRNGVYGDEDIQELRQKLGASPGLSDAQVRQMAREDNIVEVGR